MRVGVEVRRSGIAIYMNSASFSNSNHSTSVSSLLSRKQPPLASTNKKEKWLRIFPLRGNATSSQLPNQKLVVLVESKTCHCRIVLNVLLYCSTIIVIIIIIDWIILNVLLCCSTIIVIIIIIDWIGLNVLLCCSTIIVIIIIIDCFHSL